MDAIMGWGGFGLVVAALTGIVGTLVYLRVALRPAPIRRRAERVVIGCTAAAIIGFCLATAECVASTRCFTPQRSDSSLAVVPMFVSAEAEGFPSHAKP